METRMIPKPTPEDLARDLEKDYERSLKPAPMVHYGIAAEVAWPAALRLLFAERQETARLRELLSGEPKVRQMTYTPEDGVEVQIEHWAVKLLAASALDILKGSGAENFVTFTLGGTPRGAGRGNRAAVPGRQEDTRATAGRTARHDCGAVAGDRAAERGAAIGGGRLRPGEVLVFR